MYVRLSSIKRIIGWFVRMCDHFIHWRDCKNIWCRFPDGYLGLWLSANHVKHPGFHIVQHSLIVHRSNVLEIAYAIRPVCEVLIFSIFRCLCNKLFRLYTNTAYVWMANCIV